VFILFISLFKAFLPAYKTTASSASSGKFPIVLSPCATVIEEFTKTTDPTADLVMGMGLIGGGADAFSNAQGVGAANKANANNEIYTAEGNAANPQQGVFQGREKTNDGLIGSKYTGSNTSSFNPVTSQYGGFMEEGGVSEEYDYVPLEGLSDEEIQAYLDMGGVIEYQ